MRAPARFGRGGPAADGAAALEHPTAARAVELDAACLALASSPPALVAATSVVVPLTGLHGEAAALRARCARLAEMHGLDADCRAEETSFTVRFVRRATSPVDQPPGRGGLATLLRAAIGQLRPGER